MRLKKTEKQKCNRNYNPVYSKQENKILKKYYPNAKKEILFDKLTRRTWCSIKSQAKKLKVRRIGRPDRRGADLRILLEENILSYYWMGFLAADGCFSENRYLILAVGRKDLKHLKRFVIFVDGDLDRIRKTNMGLFEFKVGDDNIVPKIQKKFNLLANKTKNPPNSGIFDNFKDEFFLALLIGFIDGDGSISNQSGRNDCYISIGIHRSWFAVLSYFENRVYDIFNHNLSRSDGLTKFYERKTSFGIAQIAALKFCDSVIVNNLKYFSGSFELPVLKRKWERIII